MDEIKMLINLDNMIGTISLCQYKQWGHYIQFVYKPQFSIFLTCKIKEIEQEG